MLGDTDVGRVGTPDSFHKDIFSLFQDIFSCRKRGGNGESVWFLVDSETASMEDHQVDGRCFKSCEFLKKRSPIRNAKCRCTPPEYS